MGTIQYAETKHTPNTPGFVTTNEPDVVSEVMILNTVIFGSQNFISGDLQANDLWL